jgi:hypothetical protein
MTWDDAWKAAAAVLVSLGGGGAIVLAFSSWFGRIWAERILAADRRRYESEMEAVRSRLSHAVLVSRVQFETEFQAMSTIWEKLDHLRASMGRLRPMMSVGPVTTGLEAREQLAERVQVFSSALDEFREAVDGRSPFYAASIFETLSAIVLLANREQIDIVTTNTATLDADWWRRGQANFEEMRRLCDAASTQIRARVASLSVIAGG